MRLLTLSRMDVLAVLTEPARLILALFWSLLSWPSRQLSWVRSQYIPPPIPTKRLANGLLADVQMPATVTEAIEIAKTVGFPAWFAVGAATAAYQVEGGLDKSNWAEWERSGRNGSHFAGTACDMWNRFDADVKRMRALGLRMYRFSVDWSRLEPSEGFFDDKALAEYVRWCVLLREAGIEPMITLHHFAEPAWFEAKGGFIHRANIEFFTRFAERAVAALAPHCRHWCTVNELNGVVICGYLAGIHPPGIKDDLPKMLHAIRHLMLAHGRAASIIRRITAELPLRGLAPAPSPIVVLPLSHIMFMPAGLGLISYLLPALLNYLFNFAFHEAAIKGRLSLIVHALFWIFGHRGLYADVQTLRGSVDVVGVNHYYRSEVSFGLEPKGTPGEAPRRSGPTDLFLRLPGGMLLRATPVDGFEKSDMNWDLTPSSMEWLLTALWERFHMPMIVTESGIADGDEPDDRRTRYLAAVLRVASRVRERGVDLRGYLIWTLLDNFEWAEGFRPRFGLLRTNFTDLARHERLSSPMVRGVFSRDEHGRPL